MRRRFPTRTAVIATAVALLVPFAAAPGPAATSPESASAPAAAEKRCKRGFRHAVISGAHRCLRAGQRCNRRLDRRYHAYGFHCHSGRLTRNRARPTPPPPPPPPPSPPAAGRIVATIPVGRNPGFVVFAEGAVWVKNLGEETVSRIDPGTNNVTATIKIGAGAFGYLAAGEGSVWATNNDANTVSRIDPRSNTVVASIPVGENPQGIAVGSGAVWVANHRAGSIARIDPSTNQVTAVITGTALCCSPQAVATTPGAVWVGIPDPDKRHIVRIDAATNQIVATIPVGDGGGRFAVADDGALWFTTGPAGAVIKIDPATNAVVARIPDVGGEAFGAAGGLGAIWVTVPRSALLRIDPAANRVVGRLAIPGASFPAVGFGSVWVSSDRTNSVVRVDPNP